MTVREILDLLRFRLRDIPKKRLWEDPELLVYLNKTYSRWCRRTKMLRDATSAGYLIPIVSNIHTYDLNSLIIFIRNLNVDTKGIPLTERDTGWLNERYYDWRENSCGRPYYYVPDYETGKIRIVPFYGKLGGFDVGQVLGAMTFSSTDNSITALAGGFAVQGPFTPFDAAGIYSNGSVFQSGFEVVITGTQLNDTGEGAVLTIDEVVSDTVITVTTALVDEVAPAGSVNKVWDNAHMETTRTGAKFSLATANTDVPAIHEDYHYDLTTGAMAMAFLKPDSQTFNPKAAADAEAAFVTAMDEARQDVRERRNTRRVLQPHPGTI